VMSFRASFSSEESAVDLSALPLASNTSLFTVSPLRFSARFPQ
jgi:hypothetical protein